MGVGGFEGVEGEQREDHRRKAAWSEPTHEGDRRPVEPSPEQRNADRHEPHDGQAEQGEHDILPTRVTEHGHEQRPEDEPDDDREEFPGSGDELDGLVLGATGDGAERQAAHKGGDEPVAVRFDGCRVGEQRQRQQTDRDVPRRRPASSTSQFDEPTDDDAEDDATDHTDRQLLQRRAQGRRPNASRCRPPRRRR